MEISLSGLIYFLAGVLSLFYIIIDCKQKEQKCEIYFKTLLYGLIISFISAKFLYFICILLFEKRKLYLIEFINTRGMFYGGLIGGGLFLFFYSKIKKIKFFNFADKFSPAIFIFLTIFFAEHFCFSCCLEKIGGDNHGMSYAVEIDENYLYLGNGAYIQIYSLENPVEPALTSEIFLPGVITSIKIKDYPQDKKIAFATAYKCGIIIIDVTDFKNPIVLSIYKISGLASDISIKENYAYVGAFNSGTTEGMGLYIFEISNLYSPKLIYYNPNECISGIETSGNYAFLNSFYGLLVLNIEDPYNPFEVASFYVQGIEEKIRLKRIKNRLYAFLCIDTGITVFDVTDPTNPIFISQSIYGAVDISFDGDIAYIAEQFGGFGAFDISDPYNIEMLDYITTEIRCTGISERFGDFVYGLEYNYLKVINVENPNDIIPVNSLRNGFNVVDIFAEDNLLFLSAHQDGLAIFNISNPKKPSLISIIQIDEPYAAAFSIIKENSIVYLADQNYLVIIDVSNIEIPKVLGYCYVRGIVSLDKKDNIIYGGTSIGIAIIDISDLQNPVVKKIIFGSNNFFTKLKIYKSYLIALKSQAGIYIFDITDRENPKEVYYIEEKTIWFDISKDKLYGASLGLIYIFELEDPNFSIIGKSYFPAAFHCINKFNNLALVTAWPWDKNYGIYLYDISDPEYIKLIDFQDASGFASNTTNNKKFFIISEYRAGFSIFDVSKCLKKHKRPF